MDIDDQLLAEAINKAYQTSSNAPFEIQMEKDTEIQSRTVVEQTFLEFLQINNRTKPVEGNTVVFFEEIAPAVNAEFIAETADLPAFNPHNIVKVPKETKTLASPISMSMKSREGTKDVDLNKYLLTEAYIDTNNKIDYTILNGNETTNPLEFDSVTKGVTEIDNEDEPISEAVIKSGLRACLKSGGHPDCLVCGSAVADQIDTLVSPFLRYNNVTEIALGHTVSTYKSPDGSFVPILVDENTPEGELEIFDTSSISVAYQKEPTYIQLAQTKLATNEAVYSWLTCHNKAKFKSRKITNIGEE